MLSSGAYSEGSIDPVLRAVTSRWLEKIEKARSHKREVFQAKADQCQAFFAGPKSWEELMGGQSGDAGSTNELAVPSIRISVNKAFELVTLFGPALYFNAPVRTVNPRMAVIVPPEFFPFQDPIMFQSMMQGEEIRTLADKFRAQMVEAYLGWTPNEYNLDSESRQAIDEALIKGRGCIWTELYKPPGSDIRTVRSQYETVDDLLIDPDARDFKSAAWIARRCVHPVWQVERDYGLKPGSLRGNRESQEMQAVKDDDTLYERRRGNTNDLLVYYKIYSKMGIGGRLQGLADRYRDALEMFGDYCYIVVTDGVPFPLNLPPEIQQSPDWNAIQGRVAWPIPYWADEDWPVSVLDFHTISNSAWPLAHLGAALGELKFLNWATSFIAGKLRLITRDFIACKKELQEDMKNKILYGEDLTLIELESEHGTINELIQFLQHPDIKGDIWQGIAYIEGNFDKRTGLTELVYGMSGKQIRSAEEAAIRNQNSAIRPDDMAKQVEAWQRRVAAKEAMAARYHLRSKDINPVLGELAGLAWDYHVATKDPFIAAKQLEYSIESGSTQRRNKNAQIQQMDTAMQTVLPVFSQYMTVTGDVLPTNNLLADWAKAHDLDPAKYQLLPPPPMLPAGPSPPAGEEESGGGSSEVPPKN
jgi:hypothetical protein